MSLRSRTCYKRFVVVVLVTEEGTELQQIYAFDIVQVQLGAGLSEVVECCSAPRGLSIGITNLQVLDNKSNGGGGGTFPQSSQEASLHAADDERLHRIGVSAQCTRLGCTAHSVQSRAETEIYPRGGSARSPLYLGRDC